MDGNEIWEILFGIMKGNVPDALTPDVLDQLAGALNTVSRQDGLREALEIIGGLPTGQTEDVMSGHENAYRAIESRLAALSDTPPPDNEETAALRGAGWLIETKFGPHTHWLKLDGKPWPRYDVSEYDGDELRKYAIPFNFTKEASEALRFARKDDAEACMAMFERFLIDPVATEHEWPAALPDNEALRQQGQREGKAAVCQWLRDRGATIPPATLHHAAAILADQFEQSEIALSAFNNGGK